MTRRTVPDALTFRRVLGHHPTGASVITAMGLDGGPAGMVVGTFTSVSLDPPLVAFLPDKSSTSWHASRRPAPSASTSSARPTRGSAGSSPGTAKTSSIGRVRDLAAVSAQEPLTFWQGRYGRIHVEPEEAACRPAMAACE